ncbi:class I SAM-dependent methyltransferase [Yoonia sp. F2084L]|uniref:class I SAM-dependent methyltransferase n=1 Tax=Yoonia sp. F2084L TaxID=2926419 RepID=UPI001FF148A9|nr:class I SAM-dependent methyltransferase [Yoonia sp. F2084L]MCK0096669.1 class I SAM-dependent methyltransferase [Yoonia sp. F2084L]
MTQSIGTSFRNAEVVDLYLHRPPYPQALYDKLIELAPAHDRLLDLGCGHGKIARRLADTFGDITAVDPSKQMIALGKTLENGCADNIQWIESIAEDAPLSGQYDVVVAALSIHWMDYARLFPKLGVHLKPHYLFAVIVGDGAHEPPWEADWQSFLGRWVPLITGQIFQRNSGTSFWEDYQNHVNVTQEFEFISGPIKQTVDDFILCQHSRDTFAFSKLGDQKDRFDAELAELLGPHADDNGQLQFRSFTKLTAAKVAPC